MRAKPCASSTGLGLVLVRSFAKSASYEHRDGRNCLTIGVALG